MARMFDVSMKLISKFEFLEWRCMNDPPRKKAKALNQHVTVTGELIAEQHKLYASDFAPLTSVSQAEQLFLVRVETCSPHVVVESTDGRGKHFFLDISNVNPCCLYCGKVVVVRGHNTGAPPPSSTGLELCGTITALKLFEAETLPRLKSPAATYGEKWQVAPKGFRMFACCGPYTTSSDPITTATVTAAITDIIRLAIQKKASLVILCGPFAYEKNTASNLKATTECTYKDRVDAVLNAIENTLKGHAEMKVALVPSLDDLYADYVFPQPPMPLEMDADSQVHMFPNPCTIALDDIHVGVCTADIMRDLAAPDVMIEAGTSDNTPRVQRIAREVLRSSSYYPVCPPGSGVPMDMGLSERLRFPNNGSPDLLLLPSFLLPFSATIDGVVVVNPSKVGQRKKLVELSIEAAPKGADNAAALPDRIKTVFYKNTTSGWEQEEVSPK